VGGGGDEISTVRFVVWFALTPRRGFTELVTATGANFVQPEILDSIAGRQDFRSAAHRERDKSRRSENNTLRLVLLSLHACIVSVNIMHVVELWRARQKHLLAWQMQAAGPADYAW
jgi:hypothetical protein